MTKDPLVPSPAAPVRIAFCITDLDAGGAERALVEIVTRLDRTRWESFVFCLSDEGELAAVLRDAGIMVASLGANKPHKVSVVWNLRRRLKQLEPAILQTFLHHANIVGRLAGKSARVPVIVSGIRVAEKRSRFRLWLDRATDRMVRRHVCVSQDVAAFSIGRGKLPASKVVVIPNGVDVAKFAEAVPADLSQFGIPPGSRTLLFVGRLDPQKGPFVLLAAVKDLLPVHPDLQVLFVGDGPLAEKLRSWVRARNLEGRIHFAGRRRDVPSLLRSASFFALSSVWEGLPNVVLEAMAAGTPVIAAEVEGISDLVVNNETGLTVAPDSPQDLAAAIVRLLGDASHGQWMAQAAQQRVAKDFTWNAVASRYDDLYRGLLGHNC